MKRYTSTLLVSCSLLLGAVANAAPAKQVTAGADSTVYGIAHEHGIRTQVLINANNLKPPYELKKGQVLRIPAPNEHVVRGGENLQSIAEDYGVNEKVLYQENDTPQYVKEGDTLLIPPPDTISMAEALAPPAENISKSSLEPLPMVKSEPAPVRPNPATTAAALAPTAAPAGLPDDLAQELAEEKGVKPKGAVTKIVDNSIGSDSSTSKPNVEGTLGQAKVVKPKAPTQVASAPEEKKEKAAPKPKTIKVESEEKKEKKVVKKEEKKEEAPQQVQLSWPVEGEIVSKFKPGKNDGINIQVPEGTSVKAAAAGEVKYAGSDLTAQGELILIKHQDGMMTVYAHNSKLLVKKGDKVKQGQVIAKSGKTGDVKSPQLHFEVRDGKTPIDPLPKLGS